MSKTNNESIEFAYKTKYQTLQKELKKRLYWIYGLNEHDFLQIKDIKDMLVDLVDIEEE